MCVAIIPKAPISEASQGRLCLLIDQKPKDIKNEKESKKSGNQGKG